MNIIFLDIDGVLNSRKYLNEVNEVKKKLAKLNNKLNILLDLDPLKIDII